MKTLPLKLTARQKKVLAVFKKLQDEKGYPPSTRAVGAALGMTGSGAYCHLAYIVRKGFLWKEARPPHRFTVVKEEK